MEVACAQHDQRDNKKQENIREQQKEQKNRKPKLHQVAFFMQKKEKSQIPY